MKNRAFTAFLSRGHWLQVWILLSMAGVAGAAEPRMWTLGHDVRVEWIHGGAYRVVHEQPYPANALVMHDAAAGVMVVNTLYTPEAATELIAWIRREFNHPPVLAINTHFHMDCLGGNAAFLEAGYPVYGADSTVALLAARGEAIRQLMLEAFAEDSAQAARLRAARYLPPDHTFPLADGLTLAWGGEAVEIIYPGPGHSPDNVVVWFPREKILFGGCIILGGERIGNTSDADLARWKRSVEALLPYRDRARFLIPGHGDRLEPELINHTLQLLPDGDE